MLSQVWMCYFIFSAYFAFQMAPPVKPEQVTNPTLFMIFS